MVVVEHSEVTFRILGLVIGISSVGVVHSLDAWISGKQMERLAARFAKRMSLLGVMLLMLCLAAGFARSSDRFAFLDGFLLGLVIGIAVLVLVALVRRRGD